MLRNKPPPKWLWIGNSNTRPFVTSFDNEFRKFSLCTKIDQYKTEIDRAPDICEHLTFSGVDTLVADIGALAKSDEELEAELDKIFAVLDSYRVQGLKIVIEPLLPWKKHNDLLRRAAIGAMKGIKSKYPGLHFPRKPDSIKFQADGVHLTERAGLKLYNSMMEASIAFFEAKEDSYETDVDSNENSEKSDASMDSTEEIEIIGQPDNIKRKSKPSTNPPKTGKKLKFTPSRRSKQQQPIVSLDDDEEDSENRFSYQNSGFATLKDFTSLKRKVEERWKTDLYVSAGMKEDLDKVENERNMNKIVFNGIEIHDLWAADLTWAQRLEKIKASITKLIAIIDPDKDYQLGFVRHLNFRLKAARQIIEITMGSEIEAKALRKAYGAKIKSWREDKSFPEDVKGISLGPSLTPATRVRISVLQILAKELKAQLENTDAWVIKHVARPVLKIESLNKDGSKSISTFGFAQAVAHFKTELPHAHLRSQDLYDAYATAGTRYGREISHHFILLDYSTAQNISKTRKPRRKPPQEN